MNNKGTDQTAQMRRLICLLLFAYGKAGFLMTWLIFTTILNVLQFSLIDFLFYVLLSDPEYQVLNSESVCTLMHCQYYSFHSQVIFPGMVDTVPMIIVFPFTGYISWHGRYSAYDYCLSIVSPFTGYIA